ncbi:hypothetical protein [Brevundimonas diminuta]|uniref:hypothetical protein n=1 Tax=Brevundimonas diminuta TaxID=293 RepID=UPI0019B55C10|nr:hypothetical protein [Brevundimonas diminuta]MBD3819401.1 hypothetical protein [Brevundimonas diminuta]
MTIALPTLLATARSYAARDLIEDMAAAIARDRGREWLRMSAARRAQCRSQARAALRAIRIADPAVIAATAYATEPPSADDFSIAAGAAALLPKTGHPDAGDVLADLARDWRLQIEGILA